MFTAKNEGIRLSVKIIMLILPMCIVLLAGCAPAANEPLSSTSAPPASKYPADISARVTIAEKLRLQAYPENVTPNSTEDVFWLIDISVKNNTYKNEIGYNAWVIVAGDKEYEPKQAPGISSPPMSVSLGQTGQTTFRFNVPRTLRLSDSKICYRGQEPYSYGKLSGGDKVAVYDWNLKKAVTQTQDLKEAYAVPDAYGKTSTMQLRTTATWSGTESEAINFSTDKSPWVVNGSYQVVSSLGHKFDYIIFTEDEYKAGDDALRQYLGHELLMQTRPRVGENCLVKQSGKFVICVYASGVKWQLKVGVE